MTKSDAVKYFGNVSRLAAALNISQAAVSQWNDDIPELRAHQLEKLTGGALQACPAEAAVPAVTEDRVAVNA